MGARVKALVLAAALSATGVQPEPAKRARSKDDGRRTHAERPRFTSADLEELLGDMDPTPDEPAPALALPEPDFIRWEPTIDRDAACDGGGPPERSIAA